jgi:hypothetical protein
MALPHITDNPNAPLYSAAYSHPNLGDWRTDILLDVRRGDPHRLSPVSTVAHSTEIIDV